MSAQNQPRPQPSPGQTPAFRSARQFPWTKEEDALLGKFTDREVAAKLKRTLGCVRDRRKFLGKAALGHARQPFRIERAPRLSRTVEAVQLRRINKGLPAWPSA